jgi:ubiquinone/menaquinone biosynthesis C-methylase UbiE
VPRNDRVREKEVAQGMNQSKMSEDEVARYWDRNAELWAEQVRKGWDAYREHFNNPTFLRFIGNVKGKTVLDAGCGEGYNTRILAKKGAKMTGVDISQRMVEHAREAEQREPLGIRYEVMSFSDLSVFSDATFDAAVSFVALMDSPDYEGAIRELFRVLQKQGNLFFSISHPCFITKGYGWIEDEKGNDVKITASDYFEDKSWVEYWRFSKGPAPKDIERFAVPRFPRTLSEYVNTLIKAGFILKRIKEPRPSQQMCKKHPWLQKWRDHATLYLYMHAVKP